MAKVIVTMGANINITLFELEGMIISLKIYFKASAKDCNNPKGFSQRAHCQGREK